MEILALSLSVAIIAFTFALSIFGFRHKKSNSNNDKLPPGRLGWPIIGETIEFLYGKPKRFVGDRMKYSPDIFKTRILGEKIVVICGPNGHKFLFLNEQKCFTTFCCHPMQRLFRSYQSKYPPPPPAPADQMPRNDEAKVIRQPGFFKPEALARHLGKMNSISQQLLEIHWEGKDEVKAYPLAME